MAEKQVCYRLHRNPIVDRTLKFALSATNPLALKVRGLMLREDIPAAGTVSVVVPFYNVQPYLRAALESLRFQRYWDIEVVMVDDGSTDGSAEIAAEFVRRDSRFSLVSSDNRGPSVARNLGVASSTGEFLTFADGDDIVPVSAINRYVLALEESGSEFAVGAVERIRGDDRWFPGWVHEVHGDTRLATNLDSMPSIQHNVFVWNKLFKRSFYLDAVAPFPEGVLYEDQAPIARAYALADRFDVLAETTYLWRERIGGNSITQRRGDRKNLSDRVAAFREVNEILSAHASEAAREYWLHKSVFDDLRPFMVACLEADAGYRQELKNIAHELWEQLPQSARHDTRLQHERDTRLLLDGDFEGLRASLSLT